MSKKGIKLSEETKKRIKENHSHYWAGKKKPPMSEETREKMKDAKTGKKQSPEHVEKRTLANTNNQKRLGENHWNWKGGITPIRKKLYFSMEYKLWRKAVFERDRYTCIWCGFSGVKLEADHIKAWADYPELRFAIDNGRTLCKECHKKTYTYGVHI